jgi:hypothetical protein
VKDLNGLTLIETLDIFWFDYPSHSKEGREGFKIREILLISL